MTSIGRWFYLLLLFPAAVAHAERAVVLAPRSERALSESERAEVIAALEGSLRAQGVEPVTNDAVGQGTSHVAELTVWHAATGEITGVSVSLVQHVGERYSEGAQLERGESVAAAVERAARGAYERMRRGPGPWLQLDGAPSGAAISVDGQAAGVLPRQVKVTGGLHRVVVSHPGYVAFDETVTVPRNVDALKHVAVALTPEPAASGPHRHAAPGTKPSAANYIIAAAAAAVAVVLSIRPVRSALEDGECGRVDGGRCTGVVEFDAGQAVQLTSAGLLLAAGVTFAVWAPLRTEPDETMAKLAVSGHF